MPEKSRTSSDTPYVKYAFCSPSWVKLDVFNQHYQASVHFPQSSAIDKIPQHQTKFLGLPRINPTATG